MEKGYTKSEIAEHSGLSKRQVAWFTDEGVVIPGIDKGTGRGHVRRYSQNNLESFSKIHMFVKLGVNTKMIKGYLREGISFIPYDTSINYDKDSWISVKDKLPPDCSRYALCSMELIYNDGFVTIGFYWPNGKRWQDGNNKVDITKQVTHWMPLPDPPKEA